MCEIGPQQGLQPRVMKTRNFADARAILRINWQHRWASYGFVKIFGNSLGISQSKSILINSRDGASWNDLAVGRATIPVGWWYGSPFQLFVGHHHTDLAAVATHGQII